MKISDLKQAFKFFNKECFDNKLEPIQLFIHRGKVPSDATEAAAYFNGVWLHIVVFKRSFDLMKSMYNPKRKIKYDEVGLLRNVILHEMIHYFLWIKYCKPYANNHESLAYKAGIQFSSHTSEFLELEEKFHDKENVKKFVLHNNY